jgi:hypothetical protein
MRAQEIEVWARDVVAAVTRKQPLEDTKVELIANWIEPEKALEPFIQLLFYAVRQALRFGKVI